jgi:transcription initiation factor TFIID subunit 11
LQNILNQQVSPTLAFVVAGYSKVFIGEITELALDIQKEWNETGPLSPEHIREAYRRYESTTSTRVNYLHKKRLF